MAPMGFWRPRLLRVTQLPKRRYLGSIQLISEHQNLVFGSLTSGRNSITAIIGIIGVLQLDLVAGDAADYAIGDKVPYKFTSAVPDMAQYETYLYVFHDTMAEGLDCANFFCCIDNEVITYRQSISCALHKDLALTIDVVTFQFISAVPDMTQFETYKYVFHDTMVEGLTFNKDSVEILFPVPCTRTWP